MQIVKVFITPYESGKFLGYANILFSVNPGGNGCLRIPGFSMFRDEEKGNISVAMPSQKGNDGKYSPLIQLTKEDPDAQTFYSQIQEEVNKEYMRIKGQRETSSNNQNSNQSNGFQNNDLPF